MDKPPTDDATRQTIALVLAGHHVTADDNELLALATTLRRRLTILIEEARQIGSDVTSAQALVREPIHTRMMNLQRTSERLALATRDLMADVERGGPAPSPGVPTKDPRS